MEGMTMTRTRSCFSFSLPLQLPPPTTTTKMRMKCQYSRSVAVAVSVPPPTTTRMMSTCPPTPTTGRVDRSSRFSSPRSARELALLISYAACLQGTDPLLLFHRRLNAKRVPGFVFDKQLLLHYDHMSFASQPIHVATHQEEQHLIHQFDTDSAFEADVLSAPLKLVYTNFVLRFTREILEAVATGWNQRIHLINQVIPQRWKNEAPSKIIELCILHIAMAEITSKGTKHQIVINEAVDLAKRFCDGQAPRIINGCLRTFVKQQSEESRAEDISESEAIRLA
ncbi:N utilization substance protein B [Rhynchospora pubera]|uniref:N utilization substance protein B n=1 Tax=Rhynchospora pubera TaxID=906938 RepID=A0AAV8GTP2_9POAL|nr:N utilization substance protein B [Rhynchospora pubera]